MSGTRWVITPSWFSGSLRSFLYSSVFFCHLSLIFFASVRSIHTISVLYCAHVWLNVPLVSLIFLKRSLFFPILLLSSISLHWSLTKAFLSFLSILWNSAFRWVYLSFSPLPSVLEKTLESPLDCKEIQTVNPKGNQSWIFIGRTDAEDETPTLWLSDVKNWLIGKDPEAGKDWRQEEKGTTEDKMVVWRHQLKGHGFGWTPAVGDGQGGLACCGSWGRRVGQDWATELYSFICNSEVKWSHSVMPNSLWPHGL